MVGLVVNVLAIRRLVLIWFAMIDLAMVGLAIIELPNYCVCNELAEIF